MIRDRDLANIIMLPQQTRSMMPALWSLCNVGLVLLKRSDVFKTVIPSKIFEAMAMRKPVILGVEGECKDLVERLGCGIAIQPEHPRGLAEVVARLANDHGPTLNDMGRRGREAVERYFDRAVLAQNYEELLLDVVYGKRPDRGRQHGGRMAGWSAAMRRARPRHQASQGAKR
jgi:glycosyltransferase involved in cell wall biosynthesis